MKNNHLLKILVFLGFMIVISPIGILLPELFQAGDAWGEWSVEDVVSQIGFEPAKMKTTVELYKAPLPDYSFTSEDTSLAKQSISYIVSGAIGVAIILLITFGARKLLAKKENDSSLSA